MKKDATRSGLRYLVALLPCSSRCRGMGQRHHCRQSDYLSVDRTLCRCTAKK
jgi:hypothetical protein